MAHVHCMLETQGYKYTHTHTHTHTHRERGCVILIAVPLKQWLHESASMLHVYSLSFFDTELRLHVSYEWEEHLSISLHHIVQLLCCAHEIFFLALKTAELCKGLKNT